MVHKDLRWIDVSEKYLWHIALKHYVYLHKNIPKKSHSLSPEELWNKTKSGHSALVNLHTWGCLTYVLNPRL